MALTARNIPLTAPLNLCQNMPTLFDEVLSLRLTY